MKSRLTALSGSVLVAAALILGVPQHGFARGASAKAHSVTGCLQKGDNTNTWMLKNAKGRSFEIVETAPGVDLAAQVGHKVKISGTNLSAKAAASAEHTTANKEAGERHMRADSVTMVSSSCS